MATWFPISGAVVQRILSDGTPASGYVLKLYAAGTSTNIPIATSASGVTQANYAVYNSLGDITVSGSNIIPHINQDYKLAIYPTQAAADADSGAVLTIDYIPVSSSSGSFTSDDAINNAVTNILTLTHTTTGTPATNIGTGIQFKAETAADNTETLGAVEIFATDVSAGSEDGTFRVKLMAAGAAAATVFDITSTGIINPYNDIQFSQANPEILGMDTDGVLITGPSTTNVLGAIIKQYGDTHATKAKDFEFLTDTTVQLHYDFSATTFDFGANTITTTGAFNLGGVQTMTGASIIDANASIAAHATTMDPWSLGNYVTLTGGAVTFTAMANAPQAGAEVELYMNAAHTFTDGAVFIVDGDTSYTATIGDRVLIRAQSTTVFTVHPRKKDGTAIVSTTATAADGASLALLSTVTASASSTVDVETTIDSTYDDYLIVADAIRVSSGGANITVQFKMSGAYVTTGTYRYCGHSENGSATYAGFAANAQTSILMASDLYNAASANSQLQVWLTSPSNTALRPGIRWSGIIHSNSTFNLDKTIEGVGSNDGDGAVTGVRFAPSTGTITSGSWKLYGIKKA